MKKTVEEVISSNVRVSEIDVHSIITAIRADVDDNDNTMEVLENEVRYDPKRSYQHK